MKGNVLKFCRGGFKTRPYIFKPKKIGEKRGERLAKKTIEAVLKKHTDEWMSIPGVIGTAIGSLEGKKVIKILVLKETRELKKKIPEAVEGYRVILEETGEIRAREMIGE